MKLAFVLFKYFPFGGMQRDFLRILDACARRGHEVRVFTQQWQGEVPAYVKLTLVKNSRWTNHGKAKTFSQQVKKLIQADAYDRVIGFNKMPGLDWYFCADTCFVANAAEKPAWYRCSPRYKIYAELEHGVFDQSHLTNVLLLSTAEQQRYNTYYHTSPERFHLLPPGIDKSRQRPENIVSIKQRIHQELQLTEQDRLVLLVGSGFKTKGLDRVLHGLAALPADLKNTTQLIVIGQDNPRRFQTLIKKLSLQKNVRFLGGRHDVADFLWSADLLVHPAYRENTGTVLLEAVTAGLPVLTTANCGYANYITDANAGIVLSLPFNQSQFNEALLSILNNKSHREAWQINALEYAKAANIYSLPERAVDFIETVETRRCASKQS